MELGTLYNILYTLNLMLEDKLTLISLLNRTFDTLKCAVGPFGRWDKIKPSAPVKENHQVIIK